MFCKNCGQEILPGNFLSRRPPISQNPSRLDRSRLDKLRCIELIL